MIRWIETDEHYVVPWPEVEALLGRPHAFTAEDDFALAKAMVDAGAPERVLGLPGFFDDAGWCLEKRAVAVMPKKPTKPVLPAPPQMQGRGPYR